MKQLADVGERCVEPHPEVPVPAGLGNLGRDVPGHPEPAWQDRRQGHRRHCLSRGLLREVPGEAELGPIQGAWDISLAGWGPDWYQNGQLTFFKPLFDGKILPPLSSNFGLFNDPTVNGLIDTASTQTNTSTANADWIKADNQVMQDAAIYLIEDPNGALVHARSGSQRRLHPGAPELRLHECLALGQSSG